MNLQASNWQRLYYSTYRRRIYSDCITDNEFTVIVL